MFVLSTGQDVRYFTILFHPLYYNIHVFSSLYCFFLLSQSQKIKAAWFDKFIQHIYFSIVFSYMGGANFWGGTKEDDVSIGRKKLLVPVNKHMYWYKNISITDHQGVIVL